MSSSFNANSYELMEYLARKLLNKSKEISSLVKNIALRIPSDSSLLSSLSEVDTELKQASFAIKALLTENKSLSLQLQTKKISNRPATSTSKNSVAKKSLSPSPKKKTKDTNEYSSELVMKSIIDERAREKFHDENASQGYHSELPRQSERYHKSQYRQGLNCKCKRTVQHSSSHSNGE